MVQDETGATTDSQLLFLTVQGQVLIDPITLNSASRVEFTPNGKQLVVTLPGGANDEYTIDPEGGVAIVDLGSPSWGACRRGHLSCQLQPTVRIADFRAFNDQKQELIDRGVRIYGPNATVAQDLEPAGFGITKDSQQAYIALQPNNAVAIVDLKSATVTDVFSLGSRDNSLPGNGFDASDKDGEINIRNWPIRSLFMPDGVAVIGSGTKTYILTSNEGDLRDEDGFSEIERAGDILLDPVAYPDAEFLQNKKNLGRLEITTASGDFDGDGDFDQLFMGGSRSFSVWRPGGERIFDSGDDFEQITAAAVPACFNCPQDKNKFDNRSKKKGPEPEHATVGNIGSQDYLFVVFERIGGVIVYNVSDPHAPVFEQYINNRNFAVDPSDVCGDKGEPQMPTCSLAGDLEPEGILFIPATESPIGVPLLAMPHELSDSTTLFRIDSLAL